MKPRSPKKKDIKPNAKGGEVRESGTKVIDDYTFCSYLDWSNDPSIEVKDFQIKFDKAIIEILYNRWIK